MAKEIKFCLLYRDMWQSSGKYVPRVDQLNRVAQPIIDMGCFARVETNGGGFEQINLLFGENPNTAVREWTQPFNDAGIQTQMLERALNGIRMNPVSADVRALMFKVKKAQGTDISRSFDGLNDVIEAVAAERAIQQKARESDDRDGDTVLDPSPAEFFLRLQARGRALAHHALPASRYCAACKGEAAASMSRSMSRSMTSGRWSEATRASGVRTVSTRLTLIAGPTKA